MNRINQILNAAKNLANSIFRVGHIDSKEIEILFDKEDADEIVKKLSNKKLQEEYKQKIKTVNTTKKEDWNTLKSKIQPETELNYTKYIPRVAAVILLFFGVTYFFTKTTTSENVITTNIEGVNISEDAITLTLDNGNVEIITEDGQRKILNKKGEIVGNQSGTELNYANDDNTNETETLAYNELTIPYGKRFRLLLSDGTLVHLNAGSSLKYPVKFIKGLNRNVFLTGEAYFDVAKDKAHPFIVNANNLNVQVLGTKFNVSSYPEDKYINTVLVEGSVSLSENKEDETGTKNQLLTPGNKATWSKSKKNIDIEKVNTSIYTGWIEGKIVFEHMPFENILKKLERHYNVTIYNTNKNLAEETFTATFDIETIDQVLNAFSKSYNLDYTVKDNEIYIK